MLSVPLPRDGRSSTLEYLGCSGSGPNPVHRGNRWKAEWIEPNPGLVHYVESGQLVATWKEHKAFLKEEENERRLKEENERTGYRNDSPVDRAMYEVFENAAEGVGY